MDILAFVSRKCPLFLQIKRNCQKRRAQSYFSA